MLILITLQYLKEILKKGVAFNAYSTNKEKSFNVILFFYRASTAAHRSLPDIPVAEGNGDTGSELYETVADKMLLESQNQNKSRKFVIRCVLFLFFFH